MDLPLERQILEQIAVVIGEGMQGNDSREIKEIQVMPILPVDAHFDPRTLVGNTSFPAAFIHLEDSNPINVLANDGYEVVLEVNIDLVLISDPDNLLYEYTAAGKHIIERMLMQRELRYRHAGMHPLGLSSVIDLLPTGASTVSREAQASTDTFTRRFGFDVKYRTSYEELQTHERNK